LSREDLLHPSGTLPLVRQLDEPIDRTQRIDTQGAPLHHSWTRLKKGNMADRGQ
jgi:hypothetical protein